MRVPRVRSAGCALLVALLTVVLPATSAAAGTQPPPTVTPAERAAAIATPAMVTIEVRWDGYLYDARAERFVETAPVSISAWCPGVGVGGDGYLATTAHCLDAGTVVPDLVRQTLAAKVAAGSLTQADADLQLPGLLDSALLVGEPEGDDARRTILVRRAVNGDGPLPASVVGHSDQDLVALLKIGKENQPMLPLASGSADVGDQTVVVTGPPGYDQPVRPTSRPAAITAVSPRLLIPSAPASPNGATPAPTGSAATLPATVVPGGVVVTQDGTLRGLVDGTTDGAEVVIDAAEIGRELQAAAVNAAPGTVDNAYRDGLDALYAGNYTEAVENFDTVLAVIPSHASAHAYRDQAQELRAAQGGRPARPGLLTTLRGWITRYSGVLVGLGVLAAVLVFLIRRHPREPHEPDPADREHAQT